MVMKIEHDCELHLTEWTSNAALQMQRVDVDRMKIIDFRNETIGKWVIDPMTKEELFIRRAIIRWPAIKTSILATGEVRLNEDPNANEYEKWIKTRASGKTKRTWGQIEFENFDDAMMLFLRFGDDS